MNRYFLAIACLQLWSEVSPVNPITTWAPLIVALLITAVKALYDDLKRFYNDYKSNFKTFTVVNRKYLNTSSINNSRQDDFLIKIKSKDIKVGDIIKLEENDEIPADCVLIQSANENGISYVTTANMDGEVDLKLKQAPRDLIPYSHDKFLLTCPMFVKCAQPNRDMYTFDSTMFLYDYSTFPNNSRSNNADTCEEKMSNHSLSISEAAKNSSNHLKIVSLSAEQLLCQSCHLKNVSFSYGLVVYTGNETKSGMNKTKAPNKKAQSDYKIDKMSIAIFFIQIAIAIIGGVLGILSNEKLLKGRSWYLAIKEGSILDPFVVMPIRFFLLTTYMIPISLKITIDFMKIIFSLFIEWDLTLYDPKKDWPCIVSNSDICEDLGQVNYILSDKTGTLTENRMIFKKCSVYGQVYDFDDSGNDAVRSFIRSVKTLHSYQQNNDFYERYYLDDRSELRPFLVTQFFTALSLCHTCKREGNEYKSISPDEECLVKACQTVGIEVYETQHDFYSLKYNLMDPNGGSTNGSVTNSNIQYNTLINEMNSARSGNKSARSYSYNHTNSGNVSVSQIIPLIDSAIDSENNTEKYDLLHVFKFTSDRKRMSVIVRDVHTDKVILYCKGADDMMLSLMKNDFCSSDLNQTSKNQINEFSKTGLRTLLVGFKYIEPQEYKIFEDKLRVVSTLSEGREAELSKLYSNIESNLTYLGITAIEDELQEQVPQTIKKLRQAGINMWMLTGDKQETAQQIALSCQLIDGLNSLHEISGQSTANLNECLVNILKLVKIQDNYSVIVNGFTLSLIMHPQHDKKEVEQIDMALFEKILMNAKSVICCRVTPGQKADIVSLVINHDKRAIKREENMFKRFLHMLNLYLFKRSVIALAIGDGQNDIPMIQKAHVGVGIAGNEGLQAARSADFAVGKFRHIIPLLFKHGHLSYHRTSMISQFSFYKNVLLALIQVLFNIFTGFSGISIYNELSLALYNFVFTGIFIFTYVFDFNSRMDDLITNPALYKSCQKSKSLNPRTFLTWIGIGFLHAGIILSFTWLAFNDNNSFIRQSIDKDYMGHVLYSSVLWTSVLSFLTYSNSFNIINMGVIIVTLIGYYCYLAVYGNAGAFLGITSPILSAVPGGKYTYGVFNQMMMDPTNYLIVLLNSVACWVSILAIRGIEKLIEGYPLTSSNLIGMITGITSHTHGATEIKVVKRNQIVNSR
ncbi:predicted protein [Naegleria gruberi]|uniref:Predicted protein n=1 Tax=Naegleria gruberi TaxID=5762 RepID=D2W438_NAEGR|nr:uncharacterized protein NAEGRDRAFT_76168 [Naegleria gruberi]EFC36194.1 predicted protein [Naegleria gruberi]|eukprot:XP_002668938.1 predicted protein [Naegleria gruberi strain NEG-M]